MHGEQVLLAARAARNPFLPHERAVSDVSTEHRARKPQRHRCRAAGGDREYIAMLHPEIGDIRHRHNDSAAIADLRATADNR